MKKKLLMCLLTLSMVCNLTACGGEAPEEETSGKHSKTEQSSEEESKESKESVEASSAEPTTPATGSEEVSSSQDPVEPEPQQPTVEKPEVLHAVFTKYSYDSSEWTGGEYITYAEQKYGYFNLTEEDGAKYPRLARALTKDGGEKYGDNLTAFEEMCKIAQEDYSCRDEGMRESWREYEMQYTDMHSVSLVRSDSVAFSYFTDYVSYMGGAHPYYSYSGTNFDTETGKKLDVEDVVTDLDTLNQLLYDKLMTEYADLDLEPETVKEYLNACKTGAYGYEWLLGYDAITFYFNPYALTSFAGGMQVINLGFHEYPELFHQKYTQKPVTYAQAVPEGVEMYLDVDGDGDCENFYVYSVEQNWETFEPMTVYMTIDGKETEMKKEDCYKCDWYMVYTQDGAYLLNQVDSIYDAGGFFEVYDLSGVKPKIIVEQVPGWFSGLGYDYGSLYGSETESYYTNSMNAFTDPEEFEIAETIYNLGTIGGSKIYYFGKKGQIVSDMDYYDVNTNWYFNTKTDLTMDELKDDLTVKKSGYRVPAGTELHYLRTDNKSYADFELEDGTILRAPISNDEWPYTICGVEVEEALDGIIFAG